MLLEALEKITGIFVVVYDGQHALKFTLGRAQNVVGPGVHFKWPIVQTYRHQGVWAMGRKKAEPVSHLARTKLGLIEYRSVGQGPAVLVLNGGHTNCHSPLGHEAFFLQQGFQLIIPSRPGYGRTPSSTGRTAETFADALVSLLDHLQLDQVIIVGISAGGPTALQLAGRHPERVSKVLSPTVQA